MATSLQSEEVQRVAVEVQRKFLDEFKADVDCIDQRDYKRIQTCLPYVCKFVRQKMGDFDLAYEMMVNAQKWRKTFGVQDLSLDKIDSTYFQNGLGFPHGEDKDGCILVMLNCHLHKKDAKKFPQLQRFFVFCMESQARRFPDKKITLLFNMSECGISNMDMEFVKFIISCFKLYFPDMLNYLLVFEMPWVLQAAWKIIKGWLGEAAIRKIKFVTKSDITDYISSDQLLLYYGGTDTWTYEYDPEKLREEAGAVWESDPLISEVDEEDEFEDEQIVEKQVRFASGQPPSRQSRFGSLEETDMPHQHHDEKLIRKGSASSPGYRRRQVNKLMSLQKPNEQQPTMSLPPVLDDKRHLQPLLSSSVSTILQISPIDELLFTGPADKELLCTVSLTNTTDNTVAYKIKTTAPNRYKVRPNINLIEGGDRATVQVKLLSGSSELVSLDKFLVQAYRFAPGTEPPNTDQLPNFWRTLGRGRNVEEYRLRCRYVPSMAVAPSGTDTGSTPAKSKDTTSLIILQSKVEKLTALVQSLQTTVDRLLYISVALLVLVLITIIL